MRTFAIVYGHPESHGPQIFHIHMLAKYSQQVNLLYRNVAKTSWDFPENVKLIKDASYIDQNDLYKKNTLTKIYFFIKFTLQLLVSLRRNKHETIAIFDSLALYSYSLIHGFIGYKPVVWYHNYDVIYPGSAKRFSLNGFAANVPKKIFPKIDYFSLPMEERISFFPIHTLKNNYTILPNYSLLEIHDSQKKRIDSDTVKLVFVGSIGAGHGLEEIISLLNQKIAKKNVELIIKGYIHEDYKKHIIQFARDCKTDSKVKILGKGPWAEVPTTLKICHIGIAIYDLNKNLMVKTLGKGGSGKVYQYIGEGLPVIMNREFYTYFKDEKWAIETEISKQGLFKSIEYAIKHYEYLSQQATFRFFNELNCNTVFDKFFSNKLFYERN